MGALIHGFLRANLDALVFERLRVSFGAVLLALRTLHSCGNCRQKWAWPMGCEVLPPVGICAVALANERLEIVPVRITVATMIVFLMMFICLGLPSLGRNLEQEILRQMIDKAMI